MQYGSKTALIVVDVQNDFADPKGSLHVAGGEDIVPVVNGEIDRARGAGSFVVTTQDWHPESTPHFQKDGGIWPVHCVRDTWGAELHPDLAEAGPSVKKGVGGEDGYSAFTVRDPVTGETTPTPMRPMLLERGVEEVAVCGLATDYCVLETVLDARRLGFPTTVLSTAIRAVDLHPGDGGQAIERMRDAGAIIE